MRCSPSPGPCGTPRRTACFLSDAQHGALNLGIVDLDAIFLGELQQRPLGKHSLQDLLVENVPRRRLDLLLFQLLQDNALGVVEIVLSDRLVIDDRDDTVDADDLVRR